MTPETLFSFIIDTANQHGRRKAHPGVVYADMLGDGAHDPEGWRQVAAGLTVLRAHGLIDIEHGPERNRVCGSPTPMIRVRRWRQVRPKRAHIPAAVRRAVYERDGSRCLGCGTTDDLTLDHIVPWSHGGSDAEDNLRTLCRSCNSSRGNRGVANG